ncbi:MAG: hypothetical protein ACLQB1_23155 [Streptosporangiaceae bacterium]
MALSLAEMTGIDLQDEIEAKMAKNTARVYQRLPNGVLAKSSGEAEAVRPVMLPGLVFLIVRRLADGRGRRAPR